MKFILAIIASFVFSICVNGELLTAVQKAQCIQKANKIRSDYAAENQVSNMNRLVLDEELEASAEREIKAAKCDAEEMTHGNFEAIRDVPHDNKVTKFLTEPGKTRFTCIKKICSLQTDPLILVTDIPTEKLKSGKPGSGCDTGKLAFDDGLCYIPPTTLKPAETPTTTVIDSPSRAKCFLFSVIFTFYKLL